MIELTVTMVIVALLAAVVFVAINSAMSGVQLDSAADKLASDIRYAQTMATGAGTWYGISFEVNPANSYSIYTTDGSVDTIVNNPARFGSPFTVNTNNNFAAQIGVLTIEGGVKKIEFSPLGTPYTDKSAGALSQEASITLTKGNSSRTVAVTKGTGKVLVR